MHDYLIKTKHLGFRLLQQEDIQYLAELNSDPDVRRFFPDGIQNREQTEARINELISYYEKHKIPCFVMFDLQSGEFVGRSGFALTETDEIEVGYILQKKFWGKGLASEALAALLQWARHNIAAEYIIAFAPIEHHASQRVMQKCGMEYYKKAIAKGVECCFYHIKIK